MVAECAAAAQGTVLRLVKVNTCGAPVTGASSAVVVTDGYISVVTDPQYEDGDVFRTKNAAGRLCQNKTGPNSYGNSNVTVAMCVADPDAGVLITGSRLITTGGVTGTGNAYGYNNPEAHFSMETWQPVTGRGACDPITGLQRYIYWAWMHTWNAKVGSSTIENGPLEMSFEAMTDYPSSFWGMGPGSGPYWLDEVIDTSDYYDDFLWNITTTPPPEVPALCGAFLLT
jgi:hypothetical protein